MAVLWLRCQHCRYFDLTLYSYDEKLISHAERLKHCSEFPVKFYSRAHGGVVRRSIFFF